jgi:hypothetical protein
MLDKDAARGIKKFVAGRQAFIEVTEGPPPKSSLELDPTTVAFPIGSIGNQQNIQFGAQFLQTLGIPTDGTFASKATEQGRSFYHAVATVYCGLSDQEFLTASLGQCLRVSRYRALLALFTSGAHVPFLRIKWNEPKRAEAEFLAPTYRGLYGRAADDPISETFIRTAAVGRFDDDRLHYFIEILEQIHSIDDEAFKIARYFSLLEALTAPLRAQFEKQSGKSNVTRTAIRFALGYFIDFDVPRFTIEPNRDFEFDHIELAGSVRHKIFHGGGKLSAPDIPKALSSAITLLEIRPDVISHRLRRDCEILLAQWSQQQGIAWLAADGQQFTMPAQNPNYDGKTLSKCLITSSSQPKSAIGSIYVQVTGIDIDLVRLSLDGYNPPPGS